MAVTVNFISTSFKGLDNRNAMSHGGSLLGKPHNVSESLNKESASACNGLAARLKNGHWDILNCKEKICKSPAVN